MNPIASRGIIFIGTKNPDGTINRNGFEFALDRSVNYDRLPIGWKLTSEEIYNMLPNTPKEGV